MSRPAGNQRGNILVSVLILFASIGASVGLVEISPIVHTDSMFAAAELPKAPKGGGGKECGEKPPEGKKNSKKKTKSEWKTCIEQKCDAGKKSPQVATCPNTSDSLCKQYCFELVSKDGKINNCCQFTEKGDGCTKVDGKCGGKQAKPGGEGGGGSPPGGGGGSPPGGGGGEGKPDPKKVDEMLKEVDKKIDGLEKKNDEAIHGMGEPLTPEEEKQLGDLKNEKKDYEAMIEKMAGGEESEQEYAKAERELEKVKEELNSCAAPACSSERFEELAAKKETLEAKLNPDARDITSGLPVDPATGKPVESTFGAPTEPAPKSKLDDLVGRRDGINTTINNLYPDGPPSPEHYDPIYEGLKRERADLNAEIADLEAKQVDPKKYDNDLGGGSKYDKDLWDGAPRPGEPGYKPPEGPWDPYETGKGGDPAAKSEPPPKPEPGPGVKPPPGPKTPEIPMPRPRPAGADAPPASPGPGQQPPGGGEKPPGGGSPPPMPQPPGGGEKKGGQQPPPTNPNQNQNCPIYMALLGGCSNTAQCTITVSPTTVQAGNPVTLSWQSPPNSVSANISNIGTVPPSGSQVIYPQASTNYSMTVAVNAPYNGSQAVTNQYNYISCNTQVSVTPKTQSTPYGTGTNGQPCAQPPVQPPAGSCSVGAWQPQYSNGCLAGWQCVQNTGCPNQPPQPEASSCKDSTWKPIYGTTNTACILGWQCNGTSTTTPPVGTTTPPVATTTPPTARISCQPQLLDVGMTLAISFACTDSTESTGTGFSTNGELSGSTTTVISALPAGSNTATYGITCAQGSATAGAQCSVRVAKPSIILVANPKKVKSGSAATLGWVTSGMKSCTISSAELPFFTEANKDNTSVNGMASTSPLTATSNFLLSCTTAAGGSRSATTTVTVEP